MICATRIALTPDELEALHHASELRGQGLEFVPNIRPTTVPIVLALLDDYLAHGPTTIAELPWRQRAAALRERLGQVSEREAAA